MTDCINVLCCYILLICLAKHNVYPHDTNKAQQTIMDLSREVLLKATNSSDLSL